MWVPVTLCRGLCDRYIADFYIVEYEIIPNEGDIREGAVQYSVNDDQRIEYEDTFRQMGSGVRLYVEQPAGMYHVCYPVASTYKDGNGNDVSFTPVESTDDFYYCNITYPEAGYPAGLYPYYGIVPHTGDVVKVKMKTCFVGVRLTFEGAFSAGGRIIDINVHIMPDRFEIGYTIKHM